MDLTEKTVSKRTVYEGRILRLRVDEALLPNGKTASREVVEHPGGVCVAALPENDSVRFLREVRDPDNEVLLELPAGKRDKGEDPLTTGKRELHEETGCTAESYISLGKLYPSPGYFNEIIFLYLATDLHAGIMQPDEDEFLEVERIPLEKAVQMVMDGALPDAKTQTAILKVWQLRQQHKI